MSTTPKKPAPGPGAGPVRRPPAPVQPVPAVTKRWHPDIAETVLAAHPDLAARLAKPLSAALPVYVTGDWLDEWEEMARIHHPDHPLLPRTPLLPRHRRTRRPLYTPPPDGGYVDGPGLAAAGPRPAAESRPGDTDSGAAGTPGEVRPAAPAQHTTTGLGTTTDGA